MEKVFIIIFTVTSHNEVLSHKYIIAKNVQDLYATKYNTLMKDLKELNKCKDKLCDSKYSII